MIMCMYLYSVLLGFSPLQCLHKILSVFIWLHFSYKNHKTWISFDEYPISFLHEKMLQSLTNGAGELNEQHANKNVATHTLDN